MILRTRHYEIMSQDGECHSGIFHQYLLEDEFLKFHEHEHVWDPDVEEEPRIIRSFWMKPSDIVTLTITTVDGTHGA